jgi:V8-like Glu-specific endopeptidase
LIVVLFFLFSCNSNSNETVKKEILKASEIYTQYVDATCTVLTNEGLGSGFFIDSNIIVTNFHVIENAKYAKINIGDELKFVSNNDIDKEFVIDATPYINRYKRRYAKVTEIISSNQFKVDCEINNFCSIEDPFLIYGKKVDDAKSLDYNSFIALNTKAIQELYKIIQRQQEQIDILMASKL